MKTLRFTATIAGLLAALAPVGLQAYELGRVGDSLGAPTTLRNLACADAERIVGLKIRAGTFVDQITLLCQGVQGAQYVGSHRDGPGSVVVDYAASTLGMSSREELYFCPDGYILAGIKARGGDYVDRIMSLRCVRYGGTGVRFVNVGMGGGGGRVMRPYCRNDDRVTVVQTRSGAWLDRMVLSCGPNALAAEAGTASRPKSRVMKPARKPMRKHR